MSHSTVIITRTQEIDVDTQLEPYNEQGEDGDFYMQKSIEAEAEGVEAEAQAIADNYLHSHKEAVKKRREAKRAFKESDDWTKDKNLERDLEYRAKYDNHYKKAYDATMKSIADGDAVEVVKEYHGGEVDEDGNVYTIYNPESKWDWYSVGGRWSGYFQLKPDAESQPVVGGHWSFEKDEREKLEQANRTDVALVKDIDWEGMKARKRADAEKWWEEAQKKMKANPKCSPYFEYGIEKDDTKESYVRRQSDISPFAILHDGEWHESGNMGWFGVSSDNKEESTWKQEFQSIIDSLDPEDELTLVDVHI